MILISGTDQFQIPVPTAAAIGKFDGIHIGHRRLLDVCGRQKANGLAAAVFTFDPSPTVFFSHRTAKRCELMTREEKRLAFEKMGIEYLVEFPMNEATAVTDPGDFVQRILYGEMHARFVAAGSDLSFGAGGKGNFDFLEDASLRLGFKTEMVPKVKIGGTVVSSTYIRTLVEQGKMEEAERFLGEPYSILGTVVSGNRIGRTIGIPTVNQVPERTKLLPPFGVYYSDSVIDGKTYHGMTNIGIKPTISAGKVPGEEPPVTVETYLYDFSGDLYGKTALTKIYTFRRSERKFSSLESLKSQMELDIEAGRKFHTERRGAQSLSGK